MDSKRRERPPRQADKAPFSGDFWRLDLVPSAHGERSSRTEARAPCEFLSLLPCTWWVREDALVELLDILLPVQPLGQTPLSHTHTHVRMHAFAGMDVFMHGFTCRMVHACSFIPLLLACVDTTNDRHFCFSSHAPATGFPDGAAVGSRR